ncbi:thioredoxin family protein [Kordiimonas sediminis]|uniref:Thioredoxin family protein n=1 Tax=Kordiimonas sediminis TaxID=1735581 RepID=A0A919E873_9PROT|nr:redoxin domain-containing protein [Kordiimonas sediminis]GHF27861.1 thioredoxin family protein [Kordiimonas sediminis]
MKILKILTASIAALFIVSGVPSSASGPVVGQPAPDFTLQDMTGETVSLADYRGKPVILEWTNHQCPYVRKHYATGNMQTLQRDLTEDGAVWLTIISSAPGKQGHVTSEEAQELTTSRGAYSTKVLFDPTGVTGRAYEAKTTPQMFLIDINGLVQYMGAIDDQPSTRVSTLEGAKNYVMEAWTSMKAGEAISETSTKPYGCSIKYPETEGFK